MHESKYYHLSWFDSILVSFRLWILEKPFLFWVGHMFINEQGFPYIPHSCGIWLKANSIQWLVHRIFLTIGHRIKILKMRVSILTR